MAYSDRVAEKAENELRRRRAEEKRVAEERLNDIRRKYPEYVTLERELAKTALDVAYSLKLRDKEKIKEYMNVLKKKNLQIQADMRTIIESCGYPSDWLEEHYTCPECKDTGVANGRRCACLRQLLRNYAFEELSENSPLRLSSFDTFSPKYYSDRAVSGGKSDRETMTSIYKYCKSYAENFALNNPSLFFSGNTGLGKTHLSLAIAGEVISKGYGVIYGSCLNLLTKTEDEKFGRENGNTVEMMNDCDLLVLDDLGAEFKTAFSVATIYNIINTRMLKGLPTIISTNLTLKELDEHYNQRITSRILGEYLLFGFVGNDIRQMKKS